MTASRIAIVTGAAGFVGSHLVESLVAQGWRVRAIDNFSSYYDIEQKRRNAEVFVDWPAVDFREQDLLESDLGDLMIGVDVVFHQAGQPGVRASWDQFESYVTANIGATQALLDAARKSPVSRFVLASSSSIYGDAEVYPTEETALPRPMSPYGVTKLAAEHLCGVYARNWDIPTVSLRYFTVYGPRQRPDMAMHRLVDAAHSGNSFPLFGTGEQVRDFTYVADIVAANVAVAETEIPNGSVFNVAGGGAHSMNQVIALVERLVGRPVQLERGPAQAGDVMRTGASVRLIQAATGWEASTDLETGLANQVQWHLDRRGAAAG